jgi:hypothetical protein
MWRWKLRPGADDPHGVMVTGTREAEKFDRGGPGTPYTTLATTENANYLNSEMVISSCNGIPGGATNGSEFVNRTNGQGAKSSALSLKLETVGAEDSSFG